MLVDQFGEAGARHKEWLEATMALLNVSKATFNRRVSGLMGLGLITKRARNIIRRDKVRPIVRPIVRLTVRPTLIRLEMGKTPTPGGA